MTQFDPQLFNAELQKSTNICSAARADIARAIAVATGTTTPTGSTYGVVKRDDKGHNYEGYLFVCSAEYHTQDPALFAQVMPEMYCLINLSGNRQTEPQTWAEFVKHYPPTTTKCLGKLTEFKYA